MPIPSINKIMGPLLEHLDSSGPRLPHEVLDHICKKFDMTDEEMGARNASGTTTKIKNRVVWAKVGLKQAGLLDVLPEGGWKITDFGAEKIHSGFRPTTSSIRPLARDTRGAPAESADEAGAGRGAQDSAPAGESDGEGREPDQTPHERIDTAAQEIRESVIVDILEKARGIKSRHFERMVVDLLVKMGYGKGKVVGGSGDRGIDGMLAMDDLELDMIYVQAKQSASTINSKTMREFVGALDPTKSKKGVFITTSDFSEEALAVVENTRNPIVAIDGRRLAELMYDNGVGCEVEVRVETKKLDDDYFRD